MSASPDIFLSYSREDQTTARRFAEAFKAAGFSVWWDVTLRSGEEYDAVTERSLRDAKAVVVLWSQRSVSSRWVRAEATVALRNKTLVPVMIESCERPIMFELTHTADLSHWKGGTHDPAWQTYVADVRRFVDGGGPQSAELATDSHPNRPAAALPWYRRRGVVIAIPSLVIVIAATLLYVTLRSSTPGAKPAATRPAALAVPTAAVAPAALSTGISLAVLPFADMSPQHDQDYFSDGLSEELLNQLAQLKDLKVAGRTSSFSFKGKNEDLRQIAEKLGVNHLLEGSVRKDGKRLRITAQLINAADGTHLWSQTYDRTLDDVFAVQEEISKEVAKALSITLGVGGTIAVAGGTTNGEAFDNYLRARALSLQGDSVGNSRAIASYRKALALDPDFARAWYGLVIELRNSRYYSPQNTAAINADIAQTWAHLVKLAPDSPMVQMLRANQRLGEHQWSEADIAIATLMPASSSDPSVLHAAGGMLPFFGRVQEASVYMERASKLEPLALIVSLHLQWDLDMAGRRAEAQAEYQRSRELSGDHTYADLLALLRLWSRKDADPVAIQAQLVILQHDTSPMPMYGALADHPTDKKAALMAIGNALADPANQDSDHMVAIAAFADHFGDRDLAFAALRRIVSMSAGNGVVFLWWPWETGLRADPRFKQLLRDVKLADYFRTSGKWGDFCHPVGEDDFECR